MILILEDKEQFDSLMKYNMHVVMRAGFIAYYDEGKYIVMKNRYTVDDAFKNYSEMMEFLQDKH